MGFGILFLGYFCATFLTLNPIGIVVRVLGYALTLFAILKLRQYNRNFDLAAIGSCVMLALSVALMVCEGSGILYSYGLTATRWIPEQIGTVIKYLYTVFDFVFHALLLWGIRCIAKETEVSKISVNAVRNFIFIALYFLTYALNLVSKLLPLGEIELSRMQGTLAVIAYILMFVCWILNLALIFSCYARICDEGDEEMAQRPSRFAFVNKFREERDRRAQKAWAENEAYRRERMEKRKNKQKRRKR